jgi:hypothetical protein
VVGMIKKSKALELTKQDFINFCTSQELSDIEDIYNGVDVAYNTYIEYVAFSSEDRVLTPSEFSLYE